MTIDAHVHLGKGIRMQFDADALLRQMDDADIGFAIASPMDRQTAVANREGNNYLIEQVIKNHRDRIGGWVVANPWFGLPAVSEVRRGLDIGLIGLKIDSVLQGFRLSEHVIDPLLEVVAKYEVPVYAHSGTAGVAEPFHVAELARRFPTVNFIMGHAGASDYYNDTVRAIEFADNLYLETSRNGPANYCQFKNYGLADRVVFGSSAPEYIPQVEIANIRDVFDDPADRQKIFTDNIRTVFKWKLPI